MGNYWYSTEIQEKPLQSYCVNSFANDNKNLIIDYIEKNDEGDLVIYYKVIENYSP